MQETDNRLRLLLLSAIAMLALAEGKANDTATTPKIVLNITIDQLRYDYIERFTPLFGEGGFKRLIKEGTTYSNGFHNFNDPDLASATAAINTGTIPATNGIIGYEWFDRGKKRTINCIEDKNHKGIYTDERVSPEKLMVSTIADELKIATQGKALVYTIAAEPTSAIMAAGRNANCALWINSENGKWCSTTYYQEIPYWATMYNGSKSLNHNIDNTEWTPLLNPKNYTYLNSEWQTETFKHIFKSFKSQKFKKYITSALVNEEIANMAETCITNGMVGNDGTPDMVAITFYAGNFDGKSTIECALEVQDTYARLDRQLERIINAAEKKAGNKNNIMVVVTSTGYTTKENADLKKYKIPTGEFYITRCTALLNMFFMAKHGEGNYVTGHSNNQIYLNRELIKEKNLEYDDIAEDATTFLQTFDGIANAYTVKNIINGACDTNMRKLKNKLCHKRSGDIILELMPGWAARDEKSPDSRVERANFIASPIIFWGAGIKNEHIHTPADNAIVAPTIAYYLRIRAPNAATERPETQLANTPKNH